MKKISLLAMALGFLTVVWGLFHDPARTWANLLINNFYIISLGAGAAIFIAVHYMAASGWWTAFRRVPEAMMSILPVAGILMLLLFFGKQHLYPWAHEEVGLHDHALAGRRVWLNPAFFFIRVAIVAGIWCVYGYFVKKFSRGQDALSSPEDPNGVYHRRILRLSGGFIPFFAVTFSIASFDWLMTLEAHWYSTIFAIYNFAGLFLHTLAVMALMVVLLREKGHFAQVVHDNHLHDLSKLILAFSTFWVCMWVNQYMLMWYTNIPEEITYYVIRTNPEWKGLFFINLLMNWLAPFLMLMTRKSKRSGSALKRIAVMMLIGHWLDLYLAVMPSVTKVKAIGPMEILIALGYGALFFFVVSRALNQAPLIAKNDPYFYESSHYH